MKRTFTKTLPAQSVVFFLFFTLFLSYSEQGVAQVQAITFELAKQPCNNDGILVATSQLTPPVTFTWYGNTSIGGQQSVVHVSTTGFDTLFNYSGGKAYVYATNGSTANGSYAGSPAFKDSLIVTQANCPAKGTAEVIITGGKAPYKVEWSNSATYQSPNPGGGTEVVATGNPVSLPPGQYDYLITDSAGCTVGSGGAASGTNTRVFMENLSPVTFTVDTTVAKCTNGTAKVVNVTGGISPYTYKWNNGAITSELTGLTMGTFVVTVTDAQGCYNYKYVYIKQNVSIKVNTTVTNATCAESDGSVIAFGSGGAPPYSFAWGNGQVTQTAIGLKAGYYALTVSDANNCIGTGGASVTGTTPITITYTTTASACTAPTGTATLNITGGTLPYDIQWYTYPVQNAGTASGLQPGQYGFKVSDAAGCIRTGNAYVPPVSVIAATISESDALCTAANGSASVSVTSGQPPYSYIWNTTAVTPSISNVAAGYYSVTITDKMNCSVVKNVVVKVASPIDLKLSPVEASCLFRADGSINSAVTGGTAPYSYNWSGGQTTANATALAKGRYYLYVSDANGCVKNEWTDLGYNKANDSCYCTITGRVYVDDNTNCTYDQGETLVPNIMVHCSGLGYAFTNSSGVYTILAPTGSYTITENVQSYYPLASCQNNAIAVSVTAAHGCVNTNDFANVINPIHDVSILTTNEEPPILGRDYIQKIVVENNGTATEAGIQMGYAHDGQLIFNDIAPSLFTQQDAAGSPNWYSITGGFPALAPGSRQIFNITYKVPTNIPLGTSVIFNDTVAYDSPIANWLNDYSPWNNVNAHQNNVVGSFDPNDKAVSPKGDGDEGYITPDDSILTYTVRFQNTGTWMAYKVVVVDTLDANLDITTLKPGFSSHNYTTVMSDNGVVTFTFNNINLPDSFSNPKASNGLLTYSARLKKGLSGGTKIKSPAAIYFDFNAPVVTNIPLNTLNISTKATNAKRVFDFKLYPNPAASQVSLLVNTDEASAVTAVRFYNLIGQLVQSKNVRLDKGKNILTADVTSLPEGMYFVEIAAGKRTYMQKLNVVR